ncbi:hypothetical protein PoB_006154200 [Plakobranchus ocellatus]|uniref:Uncharacterized protein n=1 Tax=Plakobranchus ocellatus TaxID=259542 RepID=A0AAV4CT08_9GAST|nr:hypothetical protein PoB_006154200 [Plakobranchus ocellatus]
MPTSHAGNRTPAAASETPKRGYYSQTKLPNVNNMAASIVQPFLAVQRNCLVAAKRHYRPSPGFRVLDH